MSGQHRADDLKTDEVRKRLRALRGERSQEEFASLVGLTRSARAHYENGRTAPKPSILRQIAQSVGISDAFLFSGEVRNEYELNMVVTGRELLNECHETAEELSILDAMRAADKATIKAIVGLLLSDLGDSATTREALGSKLGTIVATLDRVRREEGKFNKGGNSFSA